MKSVCESCSADCTFVACGDYKEKVEETESLCKSCSADCTWGPFDNLKVVGCPSYEEPGVSFSEALKELKVEFRAARKGWNGKGMWIKLQTPTSLSKMTAPYIYMMTADGKLVPWLASQTDILAEDWIVL